MAPTVILFLLPTRYTTIMTKCNTTLSQNNMSTIIGGSDGSVASNFCVYQQTTVGLSELSIHPFISDPISAEHYHKALIAKLFFRQILSLADYSSVELNDLLSTVASYSTINTGSAERKADTASQSISRSSFRASNLTGVAISDTSGKSIKVPNSASCPTELAYFTFCSNILANTLSIGISHILTLSLQMTWELIKILTKLFANLSYRLSIIIRTRFVHKDPLDIFLTSNFVSIPEIQNLFVVVS